MSKHAVAAGNIAGLLEWLAQLKEKARVRTGRDNQIITIQEARLDGFWIHRVLQSRHIESGHSSAPLDGLGPVDVHHWLLTHG